MTDINHVADFSGADSDGEAAAYLDRLLTSCIADDASDLHLSQGRKPYLRIHGALVTSNTIEPASTAVMKGLVAYLSKGMNLSSLERTGALDGSLSSKEGVRFRFNVYRRQNVYAVAFRRLEDRLHTLGELGLPEALYEVCGLTHGLVIVAGATGSGKSTTLAALIDRINRERACHIITIEDPIEYLHEPIVSLVDQRQIGTDASTFNDALVASMRQDPDVILVGEIRDLNTIRTAITAAETGHLVFATVHAGDCVGTIERIVSVFPSDEQVGVRRQIALVLRWIVAQQLLIADGDRVADSTERGISSRRRVVAAEILRNTSAVANMIASAKSSQIISAMEAGGSLGMQTMEHDLARLWTQGFLTEDTASTLARNPNVFRERADRLRAAGAVDNRRSDRTYTRVNR